MHIRGPITGSLHSGGRHFPIGGEQFERIIVHHDLPHVWESGSWLGFAQIVQRGLPG